jgi:multidrug resistance efflux pump
MKGKWALLVAAGVLAGAGAGAFFRSRAPVRSAKSAAVPQLASFTITGKIRAAHVVVVHAEIDGNIEAFEANLGDEVYAGQELARIGSTGLDTEQTDAAAALEKAQARVEAAEKNVAGAQLEASRAHADAQRARTALDRLQKVYDRQKVLVSAGATPRLTYERAEQDYEAGQQEWEAVDRAVRAADERVRDTIKELDSTKKVAVDRQEQALAAQSAVESGAVTAPVAGLIVGRSGEVGQPAAELSNGIFQIGIDLYDLEVALEAKPELLRKIRPHQPALVIIPDLQATGITGEVREITDNAAVVSFKSATPAIRPGMVAEVRLQTP